MHLLTRLAPVLLLSLLAGCVFPGVYKINVQQGNIITEEEISQLEEGMSRSQVHSVLGTPAARFASKGSLCTTMVTLSPTWKKTCWTNSRRTDDPPLTFILFLAGPVHTGLLWINLQRPVQLYPVSRPKHMGLR